MANIKHNLVYNFLLSCSQVILPLLSVPLVSRVLDPAGIGQVSFIDSFTYYFVTIAEFGIVVYGIREVAREKGNPGRLSKLVSELLALHLVSSAITLVLYLIGIAAIWDKIGDVRLFWFSLSFLLVNSFACEWYFMGTEKFRYITLRSLLVRLLGLLSLFLLVKQPADYYLYYAIIALSAIAISVWNNIILFSRVRISFRRVNWKRHIRFTWVTYGISLLYSITLMLDVVLLRFVSTDAATGIYSFAMKVVKTVSILVTDSLLVFFPRIVALRKEQNHAVLQQKLLQNVQLIIVLSIPMAAGLFVLSNELVLIFMGQKFMPVAEDLRILVLFPFLKAYNLFLSKQVLVADDKEKIYLVNLLFSSISFILFTLVLSSVYDDKGACYAILLSELLLLVLNSYSIRKAGNRMQLFDTRTLIYSVAGAFLFIPVVYLLRLWSGSVVLILLLAPAICCILYVLFQLYIARNSLVILGKNSVVAYLTAIFAKTNDK